MAPVPLRPAIARRAMMVVSIERLTDANRLPICTVMPLRVIAGHRGTRATFANRPHTTRGAAVTVESIEPGGIAPAGLLPSRSIDWRRLADQLCQYDDRQKDTGPPDCRGMATRASPQLLPHIPAILIPSWLRCEDHESLVARRAERGTLFIRAGKRRCGLHRHAWLIY